MARLHRYQVSVTWTGNSGAGTSSYGSYSRGHDVAADGKPLIAASADPAFRGDPARWNPEELLLAALSQCHMLSYLALCARAGVVVTSYRDTASGTMEEASGGGRFTEATLRPTVVVASMGKLDEAVSLHDQAHHLCFIASSVNFPVRCEPTVTTGS